MKTKAFFQNAFSWLKANYHWTVAAAMLFMTFTYGGAGNNLTSLHIIPVTEYLGISRASFSLAFVSKTVAGMLSTFFSGFLISRFGCRLTSSLGLLVSAGAYLLLAGTESFWMLSLSGFLLGAFAGFCSTSAASFITRSWFHRHSGTVLGVITAGTGIGGSVMCIIQTAAMDAGSFRSSFFVCAVACALACILVFALVRNDPKEKGLTPLGEGEEISSRKRLRKDRAQPGLPMEKLCRRPAFYLMILTTFLICLGLYMAFSVIRAFLLDCGFSSAQASGAHSMMMLLLTATKILIGFLNDHFSARKVNLLCVSLGILSLALFAVVQNYATAVIATVLYTCALPMVTIGIPLIAFSLFGYRSQSQYTGMFLAIISASNFFGNYFSNLIYDALGSYRPAFWLGAGFCALSLVLFLVLYRLSDKDLARPDAR